MKMEEITLLPNHLKQILVLLIGTSLRESWFLNLKR